MSKLLLRTGPTLRRLFCSQKGLLSRPDPPPEGSCCGSGCANCVWLDYGYKLIDYYSHKNKEKALKDVEKRVEDPNVKAFVLAELKMKWNQ